MTGVSAATGGTAVLGSEITRASTARDSPEADFEELKTYRSLRTRRWRL